MRDSAAQHTTNPGQRLSSLRTTELRDKSRVSGELPPLTCAMTNSSCPCPAMMGPRFADAALWRISRPRFPNDEKTLQINEYVVILYSKHSNEQRDLPPRVTEMLFLLAPQVIRASSSEQHQ